MHRILTIILWTVCIAAPARAQDAVTAADRTAIQSVIAAQIDAFRHDDGVAAFGLAAPDIKSRFGSPENFLRMVRQGYQPVYRPRSYSFGVVTEEGGLLVQKVPVIGPDGEAELALYEMEREPDGSWRIAGCILVHSEQPES